MDGPVQGYVPGFPQKQWPTNTRQLMAHRAGIRSHRGKREILTPLGMESTGPHIASQTGPASAHFYYPRVVLDPRYDLQDAPSGRPPPHSHS